MAHDGNAITAEEYQEDCDLRGTYFKVSRCTPRLIALFCQEANVFSDLEFVSPGACYAFLSETEL